MRSIAIAAIALPFLLATSDAASLTDTLRTYVDGLAAFGFTGQIVVAAADSILCDHASGVANRNGDRVSPQTCFAVGSITKSLTGAMVVRLASHGALGLDDSLGGRLPDVPADKRGITLRQLLTHTSGLPEDVDITEDDTRDQVVAKILATPLRRAPGERFGYSNAGFQLLAAVVEHVSGRPFADLVAEELLTPSAMTASGTGPPAVARCGVAAAGRNEWKLLGSLSDWHQKWAGTGAGDLVTNARDLRRWARTIQGRGPLAGDELDTLTAARVPVGARGLSYGFGLWLVPAGDSHLVSIGGDVPGYHAAAWIERRAPWRVTVVVMSGERHGRSLMVSAIQQTLWRILEGETVTLPPATTPWADGVAMALAGEWALPQGSKLELVPSAGGLRLGLSGPRAMDLVYGPDTSGVRAQLDARAVQILRAAAESKESALAKVLHPVESDLWARALRSGVSENAKRWGALREVILRGTVPLPWLERGRRTYVKLRFAHGEVDASLAWLDRGLLDVAFGEGRPHPVLLSVAPLVAGGLATWDVLDGRVIRLEPYRDDKGAAILLTGPSEKMIARRR